MKNKCLLIPILLFINYMCSNLNAQVHTVSNNPLMDANYSSIAAAMTAASSGDTIYVHGNGTSYGNITVTKQLHFIGPGYFLDPSENGEYNTDTSPAILTTMTFNAGSGGSVMEGFFVEGRIIITQDDLHIRKNVILYAFNNGFSPLNFHASIDSCHIYNNLVHRRYDYAPLLKITSGVILNNVFLANNILSGTVNLAGIHDLRFINNTFTDGVNLPIHDNGVYINNIFCGDINNSSTATFQDNIFPGTLPTAAPALQGNVGNINMNTVFATYVSTSGLLTYLDSNFTNLAAGSPANTNCGTENCGVTNGLNPHYRNSGIPEMPILYELTSDNGPDISGNINISVKAKAY